MLLVKLLGDCYVQVITASYEYRPGDPENTGGLWFDGAELGGSFTAWCTGGVIKPGGLLLGFAGENVLVSNDNNAPGSSLMNAYDRTGQSEEYLRAIRSINSELETQYQQLTRTLVVLKL